LKGVHSYDLLANPKYALDFQYYPVSLPDRNLYIRDDDDDETDDAIQSDMVRLVLSLAFMNEGEAKRFTFAKENVRGSKLTKLANLISDAKPSPSEHQHRFLWEYKIL